ncbi:Uncharacterised protein r2_g2821 [Pycnogonum litorale]
MGCGARMLNALQNMYSDTQFIIKYGKIISEESINTYQGVRQGAPTSATLFILFVKDMIDCLKTGFDNDSFLNDSHCLMFADDTAIMASSRMKLIEKIKSIETYCEQNELRINDNKRILCVQMDQQTKKILSF